MKILLTGGGTGGHVIPNIALFSELKKRGIAFEYIGEPHSIEERLILREEVPFHPVHAVKLDRAHMLRNLAIPWRLMRGVLDALRVIRRENYDVIFSKGGFVSLPVAMAGKICKIPVITHESDSTLGVANRVISHFASLVIAPTSVKTKCPHISLSTPIREDIFNGDSKRGRQSMRYDSTKKCLLVLGGSSGSTKINDLIYANIDELTRYYNVVHITGKHGKNLTRNSYLGIEYTSSIADYYSLADIVITRGGAGVLSELMALGKRAVVIPLENGASRGDQVENALRLETARLAVCLREKDMDMRTLYTKLKEAESLTIPSGLYDRATPRRIVDEIVKVAEQAPIRHTRRLSPTR